jgi:hypothetical protein
MSDRQLLTRTPEVNDAREFLEITRDFTSPRDSIRESISNAIDWGANEIRIKVSEDRSRPDEEMIIEAVDNGIGMDEIGLNRSSTWVVRWLVNTNHNRVIHGG